MAVMVGMSGEVSHVVSDADTAVALSSGTADVLGTPRAVAWCEEATLRACESGVRDSDICVGTRVNLEHVQPTAVGSTVVATAEVVSVEGRIILFEVDLKRVDDEGTTLLAHGEITRVVLSREAFAARLGHSNSSS